MAPPISTTERNRKKRERKKQLQKERRHQEELDKKLKQEEEEEASNNNTKEKEEIEIEYVAETLDLKEDDVENSIMSDVLRKFQNRGGTIFETENDSNAVVSSEDTDSDKNDDDDDDSTSSLPKLSNRKLKRVIRPTVAELKRRVEKRPDLVEAHDICAPDPDFLIMLKAVPGSVPVPRHWGRKRKYLQGKRGIEKPPFHLPEFIHKTGITEIRSAVAEDEANKSIKQKNRQRVAPKMGGTDVDYRVLHDAFFKYQTIPPLTKFGDLYYEGKEFEVQKLSSSSAKGSLQQPGKISEKLREALGMADAITTPPPWLTNMQRYGPPPSYPNLKIPGLNAPIPVGCTYGFHMNGWGKPPVDEVYGRPIYGGDPFGKPTVIGYDAEDDAITGSLITSDGKHLSQMDWGTLPVLAMEEEESSEEEEDEMEESSSDEEEEEEEISKLPPPPLPSILPTTTTALDLRKTPGDETPAVLYKVLETKTLENSKDTIFASEVGYVMKDGNTQEEQEQPQTGNTAAKSNSSGLDDDDREVDLLTKKFKF